MATDIMMFLAVGKILGRSKEDLLQIGETHSANTPNANVLARYFVPGQNKIYVIFRSGTPGDMLALLYRTPGISWEDVMPITDLKEALAAASDAQGSCNG